MSSYLQTVVNIGLQAEHSFISHHNSTTDTHLFNILHQECYSILTVYH